jgi:hypothetical protein
LKQTPITIFLDSHFKSLDVVITFIRRAKVVEKMQEYDSKALVPLLVVVLLLLNPIVVTFLDQLAPWELYKH